MTANPKSEPTSRANRVAMKLLVVVLAVAATTTGGYFVHQQRAQAQAQDAAAPAPASESTRVSVAVTPAAIRQFERSAVVQGNVEAKNCAMVSPRIDGTIETFFVDEGDPVVAGQTKLFAIDQANLERQVQIGEQAMEVARSATKEKEASLERVEVDLHKASLDYNRFERLRAKEVVTADAFEQQQSRYLQLQAAVKHARTLVELSRTQEQQAQASLEIARKNLADAVILAPITGTISERLAEPGEMGSAGRPVLRIDDISLVEVAAFLPAQHHGQVVPGQTAMRVQVSGIDLGSQIITYKSPTIHPKLRTFEVKCLLKDPPAGVAPGAMAQIAVVLETRKGLGVPSSSIQNRSGGSVVFVIRDGAARQEAVTIGIEAEGWTEIVQGQVKENESVVTLGQNMLDEGAGVQIQQEEK